jgi:two-component system, OmpR family, sensor kinase
MSLRLSLFRTYAIVVLVFLVVIAVSSVFLMRGFVDNQSLSGLDDMTRPIDVQIVALVRGNVTAAQLLTSLQEQADKNGAYILLVDGAGDIVRQLVPLQPETLSPISVAPGILPQGITSSMKGMFTTTNGKTFLFAAYPLTRQSLPLTSVDTLVLATPRPGILSVIGTFIWPLLLAAVIALIVSLVIAIFLARSIYRPLAKVTKAAQQISTGDYSQRITPEGPKEIKELGESFNRMTEDVEQAQLKLRHFVADVSHELRSPLTSIQGFAQALIDGTAADDATKLKAAQIINEESRRLKHQVDELLELSRMQSNQIKFHKEPVDIGEILEHCTEMLAIQARQKQVTLILTAEPKLIVIGDADGLEQVFLNLMDNAVKNSPNGGKIRVFSAREEGNLARITVSDEGPGIHPDYLPHVFERFYQVTGARTGVGLGLTIAREIVVAHHGNIEASSPPGQGAIFTVTLPLINPDLNSTVVKA